MTEIDFDQAVEDFWRARQGADFPIQWDGKFDLPTGYRICLELAGRTRMTGNPQVGWKVGLTAKAIQQQVGVHHPSFAVLFQNGRWPRGKEHPMVNMVRPGFENELCLTMGETLKGPGVTEEDAAKAVATVAPAFEIIEARAPLGTDFSLGAADNGQQTAFVVGEETAFDPTIHDLAAASVELYVDGEFQEKAYGREVMSSGPLASIAWLANQLADYDRELDAGSAVMTGSFTKQYRFTEPVSVEARFEPFGSVAVRFT